MYVVIDCIFLWPPPTSSLLGSIECCFLRVGSKQAGVLLSGIMNVLLLVCHVYPFHKTRVILGIADSALPFADALYATSAHELPFSIVFF